MYLIDFDDAGFGWYLYDIAVALYEYQGMEDFTKLSAALLQGYGKVRNLPTEHRALIPMFLHIRSLALIGWMHPTDKGEGSYMKEHRNKSAMFSG